MANSGIIDAIANSSYFKEKLSQLNSSRKAAFSGLIGSSRSVILSALADHFKNMLIITASASNAERIKREIDFLSKKCAAIFPALDISPEEGMSPSKELVGERLTILNAWRSGKEMLVVAPVKAVLQKTSRDVKEILFSENQEVRIDVIIGKLIDFGYKRFDIVGESGEFSVRGGIIDVFPVGCAFPIRLEFMEDKITSIRQFDPYTQRSVGKTTEISVLPALEKPEVPLFDLLPAGTIIVADEKMELLHASETKELPWETNVELSSFLNEGEEPVFSSPQSYIGQIEKVPHDAVVVHRELGGGFVFGDLVVVTDRELFGEESLPRRKKEVVREGVADELLADLKAGDYVVHENYGIGVYRGMQLLEIEEIKQDYLLIEYAEGDKLYVPPAMAGLVEKYSGGRETHPRLSRLGTREWLRTRSRVKKAVKEMTEELLDIYASREKLQGFSFPSNDIWQKELEATFPYEETLDQAKAIEAVKNDMESVRPMDRLICGDVGYGKTEVAIRAAARAASAGKQVALLAPTTILVEQHYNNFKRRFKSLPFVIEMLSRFRSPKEQKEVVKLLETGGVDIVIGTHRLLSKDIKFKDLGILIIDEEQKFGVAHKEKLKKFRKTVDVLTLTATPIPRTLYFSLSGIRELSMISTPPVDRSPIRTHILPFSETVIREAILRELDRGGQVYFVHNFVETIEGMALKIRKLVPEAKIVVGHGQMDEKELEKTMLDFLEKKANVLVCTSIIESGLDITNVNTILIDHADRLGLSQLYQIRGRVGRSAVRAYAYLFYHPARSMTDQAVERLKAIQEFTALGSGYKLAMRDLEIRGSGNLLGAQQSGHIFEVGFDLYCELLEEAVREIKGEKVIPSREVEIDLIVAASIPSDYVSDDRQRIALYRRMNLITAPEGIEDLKKELEDRFGKLPAQLLTLLRLLKLKVDALKYGVKSVKEEKGKIRIEWPSKKIKLLEIGKADKIKLALQGIAG